MTIDPSNCPMANSIWEAARDVGKCLNERGGAGLDLRNVAMLVFHVHQSPEPCLFVSPKQFAAFTDPEDDLLKHSGRYIAARKTSSGMFTQPLYAAPYPLEKSTNSDDPEDALASFKEYFGFAPDFNNNTHCAMWLGWSSHAKTNR